MDDYSIITYQYIFFLYMYWLQAQIFQFDLTQLCIYKTYKMKLNCLGYH